MRKPVEIELGGFVEDSKILIDGQDVSEYVRTVTVRAEPGELTTVTLECIPGKLRLAGEVALRAVVGEPKIVERDVMRERFEAATARFREREQEER